MTIALSITDKDQQQPESHRFTVKEYYQLAEVGILHEDSHVELIEGEIIDMPPIGTYHAGWVGQLTRYFMLNMSPELVIHPQNPIHLNDNTEPEPDLVILAPRQQSYFEAHPRPEDILLLIEIADSTLAYDRDVKIPLYAQHGIVESWLFDVKKQQLSLYRKPSKNGYREIYHPQMDESIVLSALPDVSVDLNIAFKRQT